MAQMPMRICHPPMEGVEWENKTGSDPKNWPWSYHNGGHWPSLLWYFGGSILLHERIHPHADMLLMTQMKTLVEECSGVSSTSFPASSGLSTSMDPQEPGLGSNHALYQTWTIVGFLLLHHFLRVEPNDVLMLNLDAGLS